MLITYIRGLITPLITTHEPPSSSWCLVQGGGLDDWTSTTNCSSFYMMLIEPVQTPCIQHAGWYMVFLASLDQSMAGIALDN